MASATSQAQPVVVRDSYEIRRVIAEFMPRQKKAETVQAQIEAMTEDGKKVKYKVEAPLECDYHSMLMQGMDMVKKRLAAIEKAGPEAQRVLSVGGHMWVDDLIRRRLGGVRDGLRVRWDIPEGTFFFDPYTGKLTQVTHEQKR